jgi:lactoylglutathione lyase
MTEIQLNLVVIRSTNLDKSVNFYRMLGLSFVKHRHGSGLEHFSSQIGQLVFEIYPQITNTQITTATRLGFQVSDLDSIGMKLQQENISIVTQPTESEWGRRSVVIDPDGHRIDFCAELGQPPEKPFSGKLPFRTSTEHHRLIFLAANKVGKSMNAWIDEVLVNEASKLIASTNEY